MTAEFGDFANIDVDKLLNMRFDQVQGVQKAVAELVGRAEDESGLVAVEYGSQGLSELELHPKAMRLSAGELAEMIKATVRAAAGDFNTRFEDLMDEAFGGPGGLSREARDPEALQDRVKEMEAAYDRTINDVMGELDRIRHRLGL
ncbi:YbaB/EbfC family DNA-binding protein [Planomonospora sp. ID82291]|uniref:YbaB/EbfC family DNA-binding protein n=1 Tax=Planomonospora sp. ID82291 TaxID=2738136 RepID=UPI0018C388DF|nr:YbaB/EbfC family DNA-binding protein [Planomonospora sp. ID82291]MBG0815327.1 YbaB/EbfC family DNA-binding protein [Planomonospora sp. ID82291]